MRVNPLNILETITPFIIATAAVIVRLLFGDPAPTIRRIIYMLILGVLVGYIVGDVVQEIESLTPYQGPIIAVSALIAEDVLSLIIHVSRKMRENPFSFVGLILNPKSLKAFQKFLSDILEEDDDIDPPYKRRKPRKPTASSEEEDAQDPPP